MSDLLLGVKLTPSEKMTVIKLNDINFKEKVERLRIETAGQTNLPNDAFDLVYCGSLLENDSTLESYGLKSGSLIHVLTKKEMKPVISTSTINDSEPNIEMLTSVFKSFIGSPLLELAMRRLIKRPEVIENIISSSPGLNEDAVAIAILQDPDLIVHFANPETIKKIAKLHPALLEASQHIASAVHEEAHNFAASSSSINSSSLSNAQSTAHSYSLDNLSDDEEMAGDSSQSSDSTQLSNSANQSRSQSDSVLNAAQFLASSVRQAMRARRSTSRAGGNNSNDLSPLSSNAQPNSNGGIITFEMFNQAMQQAFESIPSTNELTNTTQTPPSSTSVTTPQNMSLSNDLQRQITIMHEMGLQNDAINLQALQITNGDVQAAIGLVLSGFGDN